jgi:hypothetical protein
MNVYRFITSKMQFLLEKHSFMFLLILTTIFMEHPYIRTKLYIYTASACIFGIFWMPTP